MKKQKIMFIFIAVIAVALLAGFLIPKLMPEEKTTSSSTTSPTINITYANLAQELSKNSMVKAVPDEASILLRFYNFDSGKREFEKSYILKKGQVTEGKGDERAEIILSLSSKYLSGLTNKNFCSVIQKANKNGDLGFETDLSTVSLAWKFKSMYKYRDCLGF